MITLSILITLKEAEAACLIMRKGDPFGVFTGELLKRIETEARDKIENSKKDVSASE